MPQLLTPVQQAAIVDGFKIKATQSGLKRGSKAYRTMHFDYFYGAIMTLIAVGFTAPPVWTLDIMSSRDISDEGKPI